MLTFVVATANAHKTAEFQSLLGEDVRLLSLADFPSAPKPEETADSFGGNALIKAVHLAAWLIRAGVVLPEGSGVVADDSGLEVRTLAWAPGVHSARFAALDDGRPGNSTDAENNAKLLRLLSTVPDGQRQARFRCLIAATPVLELTSANENHLEANLAANTQYFEGVCPGRITLQPSGWGGFGYDPLFVPDGFDQSFGDLGMEVKNQISHRAQAVREFRRFLERSARR